MDLKKSIELATDGQRDWVNIGALLKQHEKSEDRCTNMVKWKQFSLRLSKGKTINEREMSLLEAEKERCSHTLSHYPVTGRKEPGSEGIL